MSEQIRELTTDELAIMLDALQKGMTMREVCNVSADEVENLYALAYSLYTSQNYKDSEVVFRSLCLYDHKDVRFWMGLGGCRQALEDFKGAVDAYAMAGMATKLKDPTPFLYGARCYVKMGDKENAIGAIKGLLSIGDENNPAHQQTYEKARAMLALLEK